IASTISGSVRAGHKLFGASISVGDAHGPVPTIISGSGTTWTLDTNKGTIATEAMQASLPPMIIHDAYAVAPYLNSSTTWDTAQLNNSATLWANGGADQITAINNYLPGLNNLTNQGTQSIAHQQAIMVNFDALMATFDNPIYGTTKKWFINYEGYYQDAVAPGANSWLGPLTTAQSNFLVGFV